MPDVSLVPPLLSRCDDVVIANPAIGDMLVIGGSGKWRNVPTGEEGQIWTSQGAGEEPLWLTPNASEISDGQGRAYVEDGAIYLEPASGQKVTANQSLVVQLASGQTANGIEQRDSDGNVNFKVTSGGLAVVAGIHSYDSTVQLYPEAGTGGFLQLNASGGFYSFSPVDLGKSAKRWRTFYCTSVNTSNYSYLATPAIAPLDANISLGQVSAWHDESNNKLVFRTRRSDGAYVTGEVPVS